MMKLLTVTDKLLQMKHLFTLGLLYMTVFSSCKKVTELKYGSDDNIYFDLVDRTGARVDSIVYSFALFPGLAADTILLPLRISGIRAASERTFRIRVVDSATTAQPNLHYKPLEDAYKAPAGQGTVMVPVIIFNTDTALAGKMVRIKFQLESTADLQAEFKKLDTFRIMFSNRLEKPVWWDVWSGELGPYSRVKHELFIRTSGTTELPPTASDATSTPRVLFYTRRFRSFLNDPRQWVADNPEEGYTLEPAGSGAYNFYSVTNPAKKYLLKLNPSDNRYYFTDENGNRII
jgi:hypothetical protein